MKNNILKTSNLILVCFILILFSCDKGSVSFYINDSSTTTIKSTLPFEINLPFNIPVGSVNSTSSQEYENNNTTPDLISDVSLEKLTVTITNPADEDFSFLKAIHISIEKSDGSDKKEIAYLDNISSTANSINLNSTGENLVPYLQDDSYKLETSVTVREAPAHDIDLKIDLKFKVTAKLL